MDALSEILAFYLAGRLIKFFGPNRSSIFIFLAFAIRFSGYYFLPHPYYFLFIETMHFFNFGILYVLVAQKADSMGSYTRFASRERTHFPMHGFQLRQVLQGHYKV